jgi:hypothetical protein
LFWKIAKETDVRSCTTWAEDWEHLQELLNNCGASDDALHSESKWLANLGHSRQKWAARWTWSELTYLIHSTQRSEAINSAIQERKVRAKSNVMQVVTGLEEYNTESRRERDISSVRLALRAWSTAGVLPPYIESMRRIMTPFSFDILVAQWSQRIDIPLSLPQDRIWLMLSSKYTLSNHMIARSAQQSLCSTMTGH